MGEAGLNKAEQRKQPRLGLKQLRWALLLALLVLLEADVEEGWPNRTPRAPAVAFVEARAMPMPALQEGEIPLGGLALLRSTEPRFGGLSALAVEDGELLALSDSGVVVRWPGVGGLGRFQDLPAGPGGPHRKLHRDSEALVRDPAGRGWWVAFEQFHELWLFDPGFTRALERRPLQLRTWWRNWGVESLVAEHGGLLLLPENGGRSIRLHEGGESRAQVETPDQIADAVRLADGRVLVALREVRPWGIGNRLGWLVRDEEGHAVQLWGRLPLGTWDNVEGLAAEPLEGGATRLWFVTDDDFRRRTLLGWLDVSSDTQLSRQRPGSEAG